MFFRSLHSLTRKALLIIFLAAVGIRVFYALETPQEINNVTGAIHPRKDEYSHFKYCLYLIEQKKLPVNSSIRNLDDPIAWILQEFEYAQPPLYYLLNVPFALLPNPLIACRLFSVLLSSLTLCLAVSCAVTAFKRKDLCAVATMVALGFHPVFVRIGSSVSNDNLAWLLSAFQFRLLLNDASQSRNIAYGVLTGLGMLTKISFLVWPLFFVFRTVVPHFRQEHFIRRLKGLALLLTVSTAISGWYLIRNQMNYSDWSGAIGVLGPPQALLSSGSSYWLEYFVHSIVRFSLFPIAEENVIFLPLIEAILLFFVISVLLQSGRLRESFNNARFFSDCLAFCLINLFLFLIATCTGIFRKLACF